MIARVWRGLVRTEAVGEYVDIVERTGMSGYRRTPGNAGAQQLTRDLGEGRTEIVTLSWWSSLDDIRAFAGDDISIARYYPEDDAYLIDRDESVAHYDVASPSAASADGRLDPREIAEAFSSHRFDEAFPFLAEDVRWVLPGGAPIEGREAAIAACRQTESFLRDVTTTFPRFVVVAQSSMAAVDVIARYEGADGSVSVVSSCDVYEFRDGLVATITSYTVELDAASHPG